MVLLKRIILLLLSAGSCISFFSAYSGSNIQEEHDRKLPFTIEGTELVIESIGAFNSKFTEAVFYNSGDVLVESFFVEVFTDYGSYCFETTMHPPKERIIVRERDERPWFGQPVTGGKGFYKAINAGNAAELSDKKIMIRDNVLIIDNSLGTEILILDLYLKSWDDVMGMYCSDKTQKFTVRNLRAGDMVKINLPDRKYKIVYIDYSS